MANSPLMTREVERTLRTIFKRCVECPGTTPTCPTCKKNEICSLVPKSCDNCAYMTCIANPSAPPTSSGPNVGAIAGGVVGGIVFVAVVVFMVWWFWIRKRRRQQEADGWISEEEEEEFEDDDVAHVKQDGEERRFTAFRSTDALSTRTRGSVAASMLSRASNVIQIAFIPGVTTRNGSGHNSIAPVPPVPAAQQSAPRSPLGTGGGELFFSPADLRGSTYSGTSTISAGNRDTQYTRQSITPSLARSSVVSAVYRDDGSTDPMPATQGIRAAPKMVSVRSTGDIDEISGANGSSIPANPSVRGQNVTPPVQVLMPGEGSHPGLSNSIRGVQSVGKPMQVSIPPPPSGSRLPPSRQNSDATFTTATSTHRTNTVSTRGRRDEDLVSDSDGDDDHARGKQELMDASAPSPPPFAMTVSQPLESPFFDASDRPSAGGAAQAQHRPNPYASMASTVGASGDERQRRVGRGMAGLSAVIEEATRRASMTNSDREHQQGDPFDDSNSTH